MRVKLASKKFFTYFGKIRSSRYFNINLWIFGCNSNCEELHHIEETKTAKSIRVFVWKDLLEKNLAQIFGKFLANRLCRFSWGVVYSCVCVIDNNNVHCNNWGSWDKTLRIWNLRGELIQVLDNHEGYVICCAIAFDNSFIVSGSIDTTVRIWDVKTWTCRHTLHQENADFVKLLFFYF